MYQFVDTFDHYNTAFLAALGMYEFVAGSPVISSSYARLPAIGSFPNQGVFLNEATGAGGLRKNLKSNQATLIAFCSFGAAALPASGSGPIIGFCDNGNWQCYLGVTSSGALQFYRPRFTFDSTAIGPSTALGLISPSAKPAHGIEVQITFSSTSGSVQCWLDGALVIAFTTGLNTITTGNAYANQVFLGGQGGGWPFGVAMYSDYLRVWDTTGSYQNAPVTFDCKKLTKLPISAGDLTQWTANGAASNYQCVNEASPDDDTTYVSSSSTNADSYNMGNSGLIGIPSQVVVKSRVRKDDASTRSMQIGVRSSGTNGLAPAVTLGSSYVFIDACISVDPATGSPPLSGVADSYQHLKVEAS